jgi:fimbrial isopeptide formation D2 family protein/LPXTG-motif cell wall-anchored protein
MKGIKKLLTGILAATMIMGATVTAYAVETPAAQESGQQSGQEEGQGSGQQATADEKGSVTVTGCVEGESYSLYKIFDFQPAGNGQGVYVIKDNSPWWNFVNGRSELTKTLVTGTTDTYYISWAAETDPATIAGRTGEGKRDEALTDAAGVQAFAKAALAYGEANNLRIGEAKKAGSTKVVEFKDLDLGYYLVGSSTGALVSLDTTNKDASVIEKNVIPSSEKKVEEDSSRTNGEKTGAYGDRDDAEIGQEVYYRSTVTIPAGGAKNVIFYDKMTESLTFNGIGTVEVKNGTTVLNDGTATAPAKVIGGSYTDAEGNTVDATFHVIFDSTYTEGLSAGATITIEYSAVLNEKAKIGKVSGGIDQGNDNKSRISYGNEGNTEWDWTRTYTYSFNIFKHDANKQPLAGAEFSLFRGQTTTGEAVKLVSLGERTITVKVTTETGATEDKQVTANAYRFAVSTDTTTTVTMITPASGYVVVDGLDGDTYALKETKAPTGYNRIGNDIAVQVTADASTQIDTNSHQTKNIDNTDIDYTVGTNGIISVLNETGVLLPSTGGIGTTIFYIIGGILIVAGVAYFIVRRKANAQ